MNCRNCGYNVKHSTDGYCINCGTKVRGGFLSKLFSSEKKSEKSNEPPKATGAMTQTTTLEGEQPTVGEKSEETPANAAPKPQKEEASVIVEILRHLLLPSWVLMFDEKEKEEDEDLLVYTMPHLENMEYVRSRGGTW